MRIGWKSSFGIINKYFDKEIKMSCNIEPTDKKEFGINVYKKLNDTYGQKNYYEVAEIKEVVKVLDYPVSWGVGLWLHL